MVTTPERAIERQQQSPGIHSSALPPSPTPTIIWLLLFVLLAAGIGMAGWIYFQGDEKHFHAVAERQLTAIADLKMTELVQWRRERLGDGDMLLHNAIFTALVRRTLHGPDAADAQRQLQVWLENIRVSHDYDNAYLLDIHGIIRESTPADMLTISPPFASDISSVLSSGQVMLRDFYVSTHDKHVHLGVLVPIFDDWPAHRPLGVIYLRIDPSQVLYPFIKRWPMLSLTAETLLVRREGNEVLLLNELRFQQHTALNLSEPLTRVTLPSTQAALGRTGIFHGIGYRGEPVLAAIRQIPDSRWALIARIDTAEAYAPLQAQYWQLLVLIGVMLFAAGTGVGLARLHQRNRYYRIKHKSVMDRAKLGAIVESSEDAIIGINLEGIITSWNASAQRIYGYSAAEAIGSNISVLYVSEPLNEFPQLLEQMIHGETVERYEVERRHKNGDRLYLSLTLSLVKDERGSVVGAAAFSRDISQRKQAEEALQRAYRTLRVMNACDHALVYARDEQELTAQVCRALVELGGFRMAWVGMAEMDVEQTVRPIAVAGYDNGYVQAAKITWGDSERGQGPTGTTIRSGQMIINPDFATESRMSPWRSEALLRGYASSISLPLHMEGGTPGALTIYADHKDAFSHQHEVSMLNDLASDLAFGLQALRNTAMRKQAETRLEEAQRIGHAGSYEFFISENRWSSSTVLDEIFGIDQQYSRSLAGWLRLIHPDDRDGMSGYLQHSILTARQPFDRDYRIVRPADDTVRWVHGRGELQLDAHGMPWCLVGMIQDITERKQVEEALKASEDRYHAMFEQAGDGILLHDPHGHVVAVNETLARMHGFTVEEMARITLGGLDVPGTPAIPERLSRIMTGETLTFEVEHYHKNGYTFPIMVTANLISSGSEQLIMAVHHDISERKRAEKALRESEEKYRSLFESSHDAIFTLEPPTWLTTSGNRAAMRMFGLQTVEELTGLSPRTVFPGRQPDGRASLEKAMAMLRTALREGAHLFEWSFQRMNGEEFPAIVLMNKVEFSGQLYIQANIRDITGQKQAEEAHRALEEQFRQQQRLESVGQLAAGVAHDFNNLLTGITGYAKFAHDAAAADSAIRKDLASVLALTRRATDLTRQLLAFSRKQTLQPIVLNVNLVVGDLVKILGRLLGEHIQIDSRLAEDLSLVKADPGQLEQVLINLAVNARDAMPAGGTLTIGTENITLDKTYARLHAGTQPGPYVLLTVTDNGCGMDASISEHIFEPFFTTKEIGKGTGLGLSTVYGIIKQHGGDIRVYSEPGIGTTFKVYLPRVEESCTTQLVRNAPLPPGEKTILIVEDELNVREVAARILEEHGYRVLTTGSCAQADVLLAEHGATIALLLTDVIMPERNGYQLFTAAQPLYPQLRVLYMSGFPDNAIKNQVMLDAGTAFLQKPFAANALLEKVREVLEHP